MSGIRVTYSGIISFVTGLLSLFTGLAFMIIVTRMLSPQEFGTWGLIIGLLVYGMILDTVVSTWAKRETARGIRSGMTAILSHGIFTIGGIFIYIISAYFVGTQPHVEHDILFLAVIIVPLRSLDKILSAINHGWKPQIVSYATLSSEIIKIPMALIFLYFFGMKVEGVIFTFAIALLTGNIIQIILGRSKIRTKIQKQFLKKYLRLTWLPIFPRLAELLRHSDVVIFSVVTGSVIGIAYYSASFIVASLVASAGAISITVSAKLLEGGKRTYMQENLRLLIYFAIPSLALSVTFARPGLFALNPLYEIASTVVIFMTIYTLLLTLNETFMGYLFGIESVDKKDSTFKDYLKSKLFVLPLARVIQFGAYLCILAVVLFLSTNDKSQLELVIFWSIIAFSTQLPITIYLYVLVRRNFSLSFEPVSIFKYLLVSIGVFGMVYVLTEKFLEYNENIFEFIPSVLLFIILAIGSYLGITFLIDLKTRKFFRAILSEIRGKII